MSLWQENVPFPKRCRPLPTGYHIVQLDSGHYMWIWSPTAVADDYEFESEIHCNKWAVWRGVFEHYDKRARTTP